MAKRSRKPKPAAKLADPNTTAFGVAQALGADPTPESTAPPAGGKARAAKMTEAQRRAAAKKAAAR